MGQIRTKLATTLAVALALSASMLPAMAQDASVAEQTVDAMNKLWGKHPGIRANHAKGIVTEGSFVPSRQAARLSKAALFAGPAVPVTARFSNATGIPDLHDGKSSANPHGMAVKFRLPDGSEVDIVENSLKFFPVATPTEFRDLLQSVAESGPDAARPTKLETFMAGHPAAPRAFASTATPVSYARETYNGINSFVFVDKAGKRQPFRFQVVPVAGAAHLTATDAAKQKPDFLIEDLKARLARQPVRFRLMARLPRPGDPIDDATKAWPDDRRAVELGTITLTKVAADSAAASKTLVFMPENLTDGIEASADPLINARTQAYVVSFGRRSQ